MTQSTETVSQRDYEAAQVLFDDILGDAASYAEFNRASYREAAVRTLTEAFANKDETIANLREALDRLLSWWPEGSERSQVGRLKGSAFADDLAFARALTSTKKEG